MNIVDVLDIVKNDDLEFVPFLGDRDHSKVLVGHEVRRVFGNLDSVKRIYLEDLSYEAKKTRQRRKSSDVQADKRSPQAESQDFESGRLSSIDLQARIAESC